MEFMKREWFKLSVLLFVILALLFYFSPEVKIKKVELTDRGVLNSSSSPLFISDAIKNVYKKYEYGPGARIIGADERRVWFKKPHETEGCNTYTYIELSTGEEVDSGLRSCPNIDISESYPFYIEDCSYSDCYDYKTLHVINLLTMENKAVHVIKNDDETTIKRCHETDFDPICRTEISLNNGYLSINVYKAVPRKLYEIYDNTELLRTDTVDLLTLFGVERPQ